LSEFTKAFNFTSPEGEFETLGGFVAHLAGVIPEAGDRFTHAGFTFVVHSKDGPRLERVKVWKPRNVSASSQGGTSTSHPVLDPVPERRPSKETELVKVPS
jgi:CBS domain containing-hemolysin-like protein